MLKSRFPKIELRRRIREKEMTIDDMGYSIYHIVEINPRTMEYKPFRVYYDEDGNTKVEGYNFVKPSDINEVTCVRKNDEVNELVTEKMGLVLKNKCYLDFEFGLDFRHDKVYYTMDYSPIDTHLGIVNQKRYFQRDNFTLQDNHNLFLVVSTNYMHLFALFNEIYVSKVIDHILEEKFSYSSEDNKIFVLSSKKGTQNLQQATPFPLKKKTDNIYISSSLSKEIMEFNDDGDMINYSRPQDNVRYEIGVSEKGTVKIGGVAISPFTFENLIEMEDGVYQYGDSGYYEAKVTIANSEYANISRVVLFTPINKIIRTIGFIISSDKTHCDINYKDQSIEFHMENCSVFDGNKVKMLRYWDNDMAVYFSYVGNTKGSLHVDSRFLFTDDYIYLRDPYGIPNIELDDFDLQDTLARQIGPEKLVESGN